MCSIILTGPKEAENQSKRKDPTELHTKRTIVIFSVFLKT